MKTWLVGCTILSGAFFAVMLASLHSCGDSYQIDAQGELVKVAVTDASKQPPTVQTTRCKWATELPRFTFLERWVAPGDRIVFTRTSGGIWLNLEMTKVEVFRGDQAVMIARDGHIFFWGMILGISLFPLICWGIGAIWIVTLSPRRPRDQKE